MHNNFLNAKSLSELQGVQRIMYKKPKISYLVNETSVFSLFVTNVVQIKIQMFQKEARIFNFF